MRPVVGPLIRADSRTQHSVTMRDPFPASADTGAFATPAARIPHRRACRQSNLRTAASVFVPVPAGSETSVLGRSAAYASGIGADT
jgi:hypothetical protein